MTSNVTYALMAGAVYLSSRGNVSIGSQYQPAYGAIACVLRPMKYFTCGVLRFTNTP